MRRYAVVIEHWQIFATTGATVADMERNLREGVALHLEGLLEDGEPIPEARTSIGYVEV